MIRARRCGRSGISSPLRAIVPYNLKIRAALLVLVSTLTAAVVKRKSKAARQRFTSSVLSLSFGSSMRTSTCAPLPLSASNMLPLDIPSSHSKPRIFSATASAASCSASVLLTPDGRSASRSMGSQRRTRISLSAVVFEARSTTLLLARASSDGITGLIVM